MATFGKQASSEATEFKWYNELKKVRHSLEGWGCSSVGKVSDRHAADAGSISQCGEGFFSWSQVSVQALLQCPYTPICNCIH